MPFICHACYGIYTGEHTCEGVTQSEAEVKERTITQNMAQALVSAASNNDAITTETTLCRLYVFLVCDDRSNMNRIIQVAGPPAYYKHLSSDKHYLIYNVEASDET